MGTQYLWNVGFWKPSPVKEAIITHGNFENDNIAYNFVVVVAQK